MYTIYCRNIRARKVDGEHRQDARCGKFLGQIDDLSTRKRITLYCNGCKAFFEVHVGNGDAKLKMIDKTELDFSKRLAYEIEGYQVKGF